MPATQAQKKSPQVFYVERPSKYSKFFLAILILLTIGSAIAAPAAPFSLVGAFSDFGNMPLLLIFEVIGVILIPVQIIALVLLYLRKKAGYLLMMGITIFSILGIILALFYAQPIVANALAEADLGTAAQDREMVRQATLGVYYFILGIGLVLAIAIPVLLYFAWQSQEQHDEMVRAFDKKYPRINPETAERS